MTSTRNANTRQRRAERRAYREGILDALAVLDAEGEVRRCRAMMRRNDVIIADLDDFWQQATFTVYTHLVEVAVRARHLAERQESG